MACSVCPWETEEEKVREVEKEEGREGGMCLFSVSVDKISISFPNLFSLLLLFVA